MVFHSGALHLVADRQGSTFWDQLTPKTRVLCMVLMVVAIALTPNGHWWTWALYGVSGVAIALCSQVKVVELCKRVVVEFLFVGVVLLGTLFRDGGEVVWQWGWLRITTTGLLVLGSVGLKMALSLVMLNILVLTTSIPTLLQTLVDLRLPPLLVAILSAMHRYMTVLTNEFHSMRRAAVSRNLLGNQRWQRVVVGNMIGSLFVRTYERGDRVHQAMLSRGYTGLPPLPDQSTCQSGWQDGTTLALWILLLGIGQGIYL